MNRQVTNGKKIFTIYLPENRMYPRCIQNSFNSRIKIQITEQNMDQRFEQIIHNGKYNKWPVNT